MGSHVVSINIDSNGIVNRASREEAVNSSPSVSASTRPLFPIGGLASHMSARGKGNKNQISSFSIYMLQLFAQCDNMIASNSLNREQQIATKIKRVLSENFYDVYSDNKINMIANKIKNDTSGFPHIIRGGWKGHAVYFVVSKSDSNSFKITICNRGQGVEHHFRSWNLLNIYHGIWNRRSQPKEITIRSENLDKVCRDIIDTSGLDYTEGAKAIYQTLNADAQSVSDSPIPAKPKGWHIQTSGTCDVAGFKQAIGVIAGTDYSLFKSKKLVEQDVNYVEILKGFDQTYQTYVLKMFIWMFCFGDSSVKHKIIDLVQFNNLMECLFKIQTKNSLSSLSHRLIQKIFEHLDLNKINEDCAASMVRPVFALFLNDPLTIRENQYLVQNFIHAFPLVVFNELANSIKQPGNNSNWIRLLQYEFIESKIHDEDKKGVVLDAILDRFGTLEDHDKGTIATWLSNYQGINNMELETICKLRDKANQLKFENAYLKLFLGKLEYHRNNKSSPKSLRPPTTL